MKEFTGPHAKTKPKGTTLEYFKVVPLTEDKGGESVFGRKQTNWQGKEMASERHVWPLVH